MSEQTEMIEEGSELVPVPAAAKKAKSKVGTAVAAGLAVGAGAIAYDSYAEEMPKRDDSNTPGLVDTEKADSTASNVPADSAQNHPVQDTAATTQPVVALIPDHINVVNAPDEMSFGEAFAWSREKAGPGQLFEWHGELYHTCHANEYATLPNEVKDLFGDIWVFNEMGGLDVPQEGAMTVVDIIDETSSEEQHATNETVTDTTEHVATDETVTQPDSVSMDTDSYDIVYTAEDFDNDFEGTDEWVNPEDIA
ncbi:hypothetical protein [Dyadobacter pollutisoli]|jgi:hypothetical protein|uniref:Uncharacterized protein n=1 Tax=Dyadobacter pollutisoli TaxID=2910158 RepID=A0A9E8N7U7_9BACT|nr:hypothetical protein [Dyadobacter pollutisoli]WAC10146.1 hypothetical protein ON006_20580 [Dyadobacter pollutisoli]